MIIKTATFTDRNLQQFNSHHLFSIRSTDIWMVQGATSSALAIATVAFHHGLRIAHVEAGTETLPMKN